MRKPEGEDLVVWPDGSSCFYYELPMMTHLSDDYRIVAFDTDEWRQILDERGSNS